MNLKGVVYSPGYIPATPFGIEQQGLSNDNGAWNPQTMAGPPSSLASAVAGLGLKAGRMLGMPWHEVVPGIRSINPSWS